MTHKGTNSRMGISKVEEGQEAQQIETSSLVQVKCLGFLRLQLFGRLPIVNLQFAFRNLQWAFTILNTMARENPFQTHIRLPIIKIVEMLLESRLTRF
jgi:hypothetical protein